MNRPGGLAQLVGDDVGELLLADDGDAQLAAGDRRVRLVVQAVVVGHFQAILKHVAGL